MLPLGYPDTSVTSYHPTSCNLPELHHSGSLEFSGLRITTYLIAELDADGTVYPGDAGSHTVDVENAKCPCFWRRCGTVNVAFILEIDTVF